MQHHARGEVHEACAAVGLLRDQLGNGETGIAQQQRIAGGQLQGVEHRLLDPHGAARRAAGQGLLGRAGAVDHPHATTQRVAVAHRLERHQPGGATLVVGRAGHAGEAGGGHLQQTQGAGALGKIDRRRLVTGHHHVAAQHLAGIAGQRRLQPHREEAHRAERGHCQHHGHHQQAQFTGTEVTPALAPRQAQDGDRQCKLGQWETSGLRPAVPALFRAAAQRADAITVHQPARPGSACGLPDTRLSFVKPACSRFERRASAALL